MKVISKKICYDSLWSKLPGVIPSLNDYWAISPLYGCNNSNLPVKIYDYNVALRTAMEYNLPKDSLVYGADFVGYDVESLNIFNEGNYMQIPSDIIIPEFKDKDDNIIEITDYTDLYVNIPKENTEDFYDLMHPLEDKDPHYEFINGRFRIMAGIPKKEMKILTYHTVFKWWKFFNEYRNLLYDENNNHIYSSAVEYYEKTTKVKIPSEYETYKEMDDLYIARGGDYMYDWMSKNCILQFTIPQKFIDKWESKTLYYPEALKWYSWFNERHEKYFLMHTKEDCKKADDCCDCNEYFRLGGNEFYDILKIWIESVNINIFDNITNSASITIPLLLETSIDDLGEMTIFSNEWEEAVDYGNTLDNEKYGTVIHRPYTINEDNVKLISGDTWMIKGDKTGYETTECYHDNNFKEDDWVDYTDYYMNENQSEFVSRGEKDGQMVNISAYTYSPINGKIIYNPIDSDMRYTYQGIMSDIVVINGVIYPVIDGRYVELCAPSEYDGKIANVEFNIGKKLPIESSGNLEYCEYKNKKYYVENDGTNDVIRFFKNTICNNEGCIVHDGRYIIYGNNLILLNDDNTVTIYDESIYTVDNFVRIYPVLKGYFTVNNVTLYIGLNENDEYEVVFTVITESMTEGEDEELIVTGTTYSFGRLTDETMKFLGWNPNTYPSVDENGAVTVYFSYEVTRCDIISGHCESRLELLRRDKITTDGLGKELPGHFDYESVFSGSNYNTVYDEAVLDILYEEGTVSGLERFMDEYSGNYLEKIEIYYINSDGEYAVYDDEGNYAIRVTSGKTIQNAIEELNSMFEDSEYYEQVISWTLQMRITYYIGCSIVKEGSEEGGNIRYVKNPEDDSGVKYIDTVNLNERTGKYFIDDNHLFLFKYYELSPTINAVYNDELRADRRYFVSYFEMKPMFYYINNEGNIEPSIKYAYFAANNNIIAAPTFRAEWNMFSSTPHIINADDIYIDRGINAAFEKHLKLQEIRSMEALENYGISYFKTEKY